MGTILGIVDRLRPRETCSCLHSYLWVNIVWRAQPGYPNHVTSTLVDFDSILQYVTTVVQRNHGSRGACGPIAIAEGSRPLQLVTDSARMDEQMEISRITVAPAVKKQEYGADIIAQDYAHEEIVWEPDDSASADDAV